MPHTIVAFNAHPDDEALLAGGTLARLAAQGHRVVLVTATDGGAGSAGAEHRDAGLGAVRLRELQASALALGAAAVVPLGYADSGQGAQAALPRQPGKPIPLALADPDEVAERLVRLLRDESADVLMSCDAAGGYGHPDHLVVHRVARVAAARAGTTRLLEATAPREPLLRALRGLQLCRFPFTDGFRPQDWATAFSPAAEITHRVDVRPWIHHKRAALRAHVSQSTSEPGAGTRSLATVLRLPAPVFARLLGREWFHDPAAHHASPAGSSVVCNDVIAGL